MIEIATELCPYSINNAYVKTKKYYKVKSKKTVNWIEQFTYGCLSIRAQIDRFKRDFKHSEDYLEVSYYFFVPERKLITKKGGITQRRNDLCNSFKIPNDVLGKVLDIDDAVICQLDGMKLPISLNKYFMVVTIDKKEIADLYDLSTHFQKRFNICQPTRT